MVSSPMPWPKKGQLQQVAHGFVQFHIEYVQGWHVHSLPGQSLPVLNHPHREKKILPWISLEIPVFQLEDLISHPNTMHLQGQPVFFSKPFH